jgi:hypothetical protein
MPGRSEDHLIHEPRIRRVVRRPVTPTVPAPRREQAPAPRVPAPRTPPRREGHLGHTPVAARPHREA